MDASPGLTAGEIAHRLGSTVEGDADRTLTAVATLVQAGRSEIAWVGSAAFLHQAAGSSAGAMILPLEGAVSTEASLIRVADPDLDITRVQGWLAPHRHPPATGVHPSATVGAGSVTTGASVGPHVAIGRDVVLGPGTRIDPGACIGDGCIIGEDCAIGSNVVVGHGTRIGHRVTIHANTTIGADGFGFLFREGRHLKVPQTGTVEIGDDVEIGANCTIDRARTGVTRLGDGVKTDNQVHVGHNVVIGDHSMLIAMTAIGGSSVLGHHVVLSGYCGVTDHVRVGNGVQCGAFSMITKDVPDGAVLKGEPAMELKAELRRRASVRRLPQMRQTLREMEDRIRVLEAALTDA